MIGSRSDQFRFGLVLAKKSNQTEIFLKKTETGRFTGSVLFFWTKTGSNRFGLVFQFGLIFPDLARFFCFGSVLLGFFQVWLGFFPVSARFFDFRLIKPNRLVFSIFQSGFFHGLNFFIIFFLDFFTHP
jgi:hypothetical protein